MKMHTHGADLRPILVPIEGKTNLNQWTVLIVGLALVLSGGKLCYAQAEGSECPPWFERLRLSPAAKDCETECTGAMTDMGTFMCPAQCPTFCEAAKKDDTCLPSNFWNSRLNGKTDPFKPVKGGELKQLITALSRVPKALQPRSLKSIVRGARPFDISAPTSPATSSDEYIILFPRAFSESENLSRILTHEIVHFSIGDELAAEFSRYKKDFGWKSGRQIEVSRPGNFVQPDGRLSAEEDFANNVEYFLFDPKSLKLVSPNIFSWLRLNLGKKITLEKGCHAIH